LLLAKTSLTERGLPPLLNPTLDILLLGWLKSLSVPPAFAGAATRRQALQKGEAYKSPFSKGGLRGIYTPDGFLPGYADKGIGYELT